MLQNTGTAALVINGISTTGDYSVANNCGASLAPAASCTLIVTFTPTTVGTRLGTLQITDNAPNSPNSVPLSGTGATMHAVSLNWQASTTPLVNYFVYRGSQSGGPYSQLNAVPTPATNYPDSVLGGQNWYYVVTAVDANGIQSAFSNEAEAMVPP